MEDPAIRAALDRHWAASDADDFETEHEIYREDAVLEYPQSGERIRGRRNIQASRTVQPNQKRFTVRRIIGPPADRRPDQHRVGVSRNPSRNMQYAIGSRQLAARRLTARQLL